MLKVLNDQEISEELAHHLFSFFDFFTLNRVKLVSTTWLKLAKRELHQRKVTVLFWKNPSFEKNDSFDITIGISFGHVAMQTYAGGKDNQGYYISFFPGQCAEWHADEPQLCQENKPHFHTRKQDNLIYRGNPTTKIKLHCLTSKKINEDFKSFKKSNYNWSKLGSSPIDALVGRGLNKQSKNCAGLTHLLLTQAGILEYTEETKDKSRVITLMLLPAFLTAIGLAAFLIAVDNFHVLFLLKKTLAKANEAILQSNSLNDSMIKEFTNLKELSDFSKSLLEQVVSEKHTDFIDMEKGLLDLHISHGASAIQALLSNAAFGHQFLDWLNSGWRGTITICAASSCTSIVSFGLAYLSSQLALGTVTPEDIKKMAKRAKENERKRAISDFHQAQVKSSPGFNESSQHETNFSVKRFCHDYKYPLLSGATALLLGAVGIYAYKNSDRLPTLPLPFSFNKGFSH